MIIDGTASMSRNTNNGKTASDRLSKGKKGKENSKIIVDADACPGNVLQICYRLGEKFSRPVWTVASFNHCVGADNHIVVGNDPGEADLKIINFCQRGDVVITQDGGLAAMVVGKGAHCLGPSGHRFRPDAITNLLEIRAAKGRYRRAGGRTGGPCRRTAEDDRRFARSLEQVLRGKE